MIDDDQGGTRIGMTAIAGRGSAGAEERQHRGADSIRGFPFRPHQETVIGEEVVVPLLHLPGHVEAVERLIGRVRRAA